MKILETRSNTVNIECRHDKVGEASAAGHVSYERQSQLNTRLVIAAAISVSILIIADQTQ